MDHLHNTAAPAAVITTGRPLLTRLLERTTPGPNGCVIYTGYVNSSGYGTIGTGGKHSKPVFVHRAAYELLVESIPDGMHIDHLCHTHDLSCDGGDGCLHRRCVNPRHMEVVLPGENTLRARGPAAANKAKTACHRGHPFDDANTYIRPDGGGRTCRQCTRERYAEKSALREAKMDRQRRRRLKAQIGTPECGHTSRRGNVCTRPAGHDGRHNSAAPPLMQSNQAFRALDAETDTAVSTIVEAGQRCPAAHPDDPTPCVGPVVVTILDRSNAGVDGCEHHAARLLASLDGGRVYGLPDAPSGAAIRVFKAADSTRPFAWYENAPRTRPEQLSRAEARERGEGQ